jgi:hypothetical protein
MTSLSAAWSIATVRSLQGSYGFGEVACRQKITGPDPSFRSDFRSWVDQVNSIHYWTRDNNPFYVG